MVEPDRFLSTTFWGKYEPKTETILSLPAHCLDVGMVFHALCLLNSISQGLECVGRISLSRVHIDRLAVLAMLHDLGKANHGFRGKIFGMGAPYGGHTNEVGALLADTELCQRLIGALPSSFVNWFASEDCVLDYLTVTVSHHGRPVDITATGKANHYLDASLWRQKANIDPLQGVADIVEWAATAFPLAWHNNYEPLPVSPDFKWRICGLVTLADWLGSHTAWFPVEHTDYNARADANRHKIPQLLKAVGLDVTSLRPVVQSGPSTFKGRFGVAPRLLQDAVDRLMPENPSCSLIIAESETGSGKTEAALNWFYKAFGAGRVDSLYFALPTRVAARELYMRVLGSMGQMFPDPQTRPVTVLAVPGYAQVDGIPDRNLLPDEFGGALWSDDSEAGLSARWWAAERPKRFLAATVAVGTIDQAILSAVQSNHAHLRSVCLDRSLLVVDEVHASDHYMSKLLEHLVAGHTARGGMAMMLSATLGGDARSRYLCALTRDKEALSYTKAAEYPYPSVTLANGTVLELAATGHKKDVAVDLWPRAEDLSHIADQVSAMLKDGARILVVLNTVSRAVALLKLIEVLPNIAPESMFSCSGAICPHHGRFAPADRVLLDAEVSRRLCSRGADGPIVVVGTQTLEQSLDIDADLLICDLAPSDVLLQRIGRLHRHARIRPSAFTQPRCIVLAPCEGDLSIGLNDKGIPSAGYRKMGLGSVYRDLRTIELTRRALATNPRICIPQDNRRLVESATHPEPLTALAQENAKWACHGQDVTGMIMADRIVSSHALLHADQTWDRSVGDRVRTRLHADGWLVRLSRSIISPFGQEISEIVIPGHMAPKVRGDVVDVDVSGGDYSLFRSAEKRYSYSRYGLEDVVDEPSK